MKISFRLVCFCLLFERAGKISGARRSRWFVFVPNTTAGTATSDRKEDRTFKTIICLWSLSSALPGHAKMAKDKEVKPLTDLCAKAILRSGGSISPFWRDEKWPGGTRCQCTLITGIWRPQTYESIATCEKLLNKKIISSLSLPESLQTFLFKVAKNICSENREEKNKRKLEWGPQDFSVLFSKSKK